MTPGTVVEGTVVGITNFGAFVQIEGAGTGLIHISEIANEYVRDVNNHLKMNEKVKVKVLNVDPSNGKVDLSLKQAAAPSTPGLSAPVRTGPPQPSNTMREPAGSRFHSGRARGPAGCDSNFLARSIALWLGCGPSLWPTPCAGSGSRRGLQPASPRGSAGRGGTR